MRFPKLIALILSLALPIASPYASAGVGAGGGGGKNEPLFEEIANNIATWIKSGNADEIASQLPKEISLSQYKTQMLSVLEKFHITFTDDKVLVDGFEKTCRGYVDKSGINRILCNNAQFGSETPENINKIYRQVHHEFAGLACENDNGQNCLEQNKNEDSDYRISNQISAFLKKEVVSRLPVKPIVSVGGQAAITANIMGCYGKLIEKNPQDSGIIVVYRQGSKLRSRFAPIFPSKNDPSEGAIMFLVGKPGDLNSSRLKQEIDLSLGRGLQFIAQEMNWPSTTVFIKKDYSGSITANLISDMNNVSVRLTCTTDINLVAEAIKSANLFSPL